MKNPIVALQDFFGRKRREKPEKMRITRMERRALPFYIALMTIPIIQFIIFYVGVNFNSILMAFQSYDTLTGVTTMTLDNFRRIKAEFIDNSMWIYLGNSLLAYGVGIFFMPVTLFFS